MTYEYIRVTYGWHTSTYEWHTGTYDKNTDDIRIHTSDIWMAYEYIRGTYGWYTSTNEWHTGDIRVHRDKYERIQMTSKWHTNDIRNIKPYKGFWAFRSQFSKLFAVKTLFWAVAKYFGPLLRFPYFFTKIFLGSTTEFGNLNNLKRGPYYILPPRSVLFFLSDLWRIIFFCILSPVKIYVVFICSLFNQRDYT